MFILSIVVSLIIAAIICRREQSLIDVCFCTFIIVSGLGTNFNNAHRIGNLMPADVTTFICIIILFLYGPLRKKVVERKVGLFYIFGILGLIMGIFMGNSISDIFRDVKNYLYYLVPICYLMEYRGIPEKMKNVLVSIGVAGVYTIYNMLYTFFFVKGISTMAEDGVISKSFGIGIGADFVFLIAILLFFYPRIVSKYIGTIGWALIELLLVFTSFSSFVRSSWVVMVVTILGTIVLYILNGALTRGSAEINVHKLKSYVVLLAIVMCIVPIAQKNISPKVYQFIDEKVDSIRTITEDEGSTLTYRINDVKANSELINSPAILTGYGFGQIIVDQTGRWRSTSAENSFLYYIVKFGVIGFAYLCCVVASEIIKKLRYSFGLNNCIGVFLIVTLIIQAMSGNLNKYYISPFFVVLFMVDIEDLFNKVLEDE